MEPQFAAQGLIEISQSQSSILFLIVLVTAAVFVRSCFPAKRVDEFNRGLKKN